MNTMVDKALSVHIRWMIRRDMLSVLGIEQQSFEFPWIEEDFISALKHRNCIGLVAEHGERILGFVIYEFNKYNIHILDFAILENKRRMGIGRQMIQHLIGKLKIGRKRIKLEIRETNVGAQLFFKSMGFRAISILKNFYDDTPEDAYLMQFNKQI